MEEAVGMLSRVFGESRSSKIQFSGSQSDLVLAAISEIENFGVLTAVVSSILNELRNSGATSMPVSIRRFIPSTPLVLKQFSKLTNPILKCDIETHLVYLGAQISVGQYQLRRSLEDNTEFLSHLEVDQVCHAWRGICDQVLVVMADLELLAEDMDAASINQVFRRELVGHLADARDGGTGLSLSRDVDFQRWAQARRHRRVLLNAMGTAHCMGEVRLVLVTDASVGGVGLDFAEGFREGEGIKLVLTMGREFVGRVAWSAGTRVGVQFESELDHHDVLFDFD